MTWREFTLYSTAHERKELNEWSRTRRLAYIIYCGIPSDRPKMKEQDFWPLPIDEKTEESKPLTPDEIQRMVTLLQGTKENKA